MLILFNIDLLILPISLLAGFIDPVAGMVEKSFFLVFQGFVKQLLVPLISIIPNISQLVLRTLSLLLSRF